MLSQGIGDRVDECGEEVFDFDHRCVLCFGQLGRSPNLLACVTSESFRHVDSFVNRRVNEVVARAFSVRLTVNDRPRINAHPLILASSEPTTARW